MLANVALPWSCLRQRLGVELAVLMCGSVFFRKFWVFFDACGWSGAHFFIKMSSNLQIRKSMHKSGHQLQIADHKSRKIWREFDEIKKCAHGSSLERSVLTGPAHENRHLNPQAAPNLCRKQFWTVLYTSPCVYDRKVSKMIEKYRKMVKIDQNWDSEKVRFPTVKVAENLHTVSPRYSEWLACIKSWGTGTFPIPNSKVTK